MTGWSALLPRYAPLAAKMSWLLNLARPGAGRGEAFGMRWPASPRDANCRAGAATFSAIAQQPGRRPVAKSYCSPTPSTAISSAKISMPPLDVLVAGGYRVQVAAPADNSSRPLCCGRTFLSVGDVDKARAEATPHDGGASPYIARDVPVIGLEPSCILGFRDEIPALIKSDDARRLAANALTFEEFLAREQGAGRLALPLRELRKRALRARSLSPEIVRRLRSGGDRAEAGARSVGRDGGIELLRHGRQLRLWRRHRRCVACDGGIVAAAGGPQGAGGCHHRSGRHVMPATNRRWHRPRSLACGACAGLEPRAGGQCRRGGPDALAVAADLAGRLLRPAGMADRPQESGRALSAARARERALARGLGIPRPGTGRRHFARDPRPGTRRARHHHGWRDAAGKLFQPVRDRARGRRHRQSRHRTRSLRASESGAACHGQGAPQACRSRCATCNSCARIPMPSSR